MFPLQMRSLLISSLTLLLAGCGSAYKSLQPSAGDPFCIQAFRPAFTAELYKARVEVVGKNLSGLLLIKTMEDSTRRVVFSTETGVKFFDFEFGQQGVFRKHFVMKRLNKKMVVDALRNDFDLVMMNGIGEEAGQVARREGNWYYGYERGKKIAWYQTDANCSELLHAELGSKRKKLVEAKLFSAAAGPWRKGTVLAPDSVFIQHHNFNFNISLKKLDR